MGRFTPRSWARRTPSEKRQAAARGGLVVFALVVLVAIPAYLGSRPAFMERYPAYEHAYVTWSDSLHARVSCQQCHVPPGVIARTAHGARMLGEFYLSFAPVHREPDLLGTPTNDACDRCHMELRTVSPSGDLLIPHRAHVEMLGMECVECHDFVVHEPGPNGTSTPTMAGCMTCHDGDVAKSDCSACHTDKDPPDSHFEPAWLVVHADADAEDETCTTCHEWTERWCADCHAVRPDSHGEEWRAEHRYRVEAHRNCEACHEGSFCIRCHGIVPALNYDSSLTLVR